jgi:hypothetical protein
MSKIVVVVCLAGLMAAMILPAACAGEGTPNLGTSQLVQTDSRWFVDARIFEVDRSFQDRLDNTTWTIGFAAPINEKTQFSLKYSSVSNTGKDAINGSLRKSDRPVLAPTVKRLISGASSKAAVAFEIGADVATKKATGENLNSGAVAYQDNFTPAAKLQAEWGKEGAFQWQLASQIAFWDNTCATSVGGGVPGFGTVIGVGGGVVMPFGKKLTIVADAMGLMKGDNYIDESTNQPDNTIVWSAGGRWALGGASNSVLSVYATNSMGPTLGSSLIASPGDSVGLSVALTRDF